MRLGLRFPNTIGLSVAIALSGSGLSYAAGQPADVPAWLQAHMGEGEGQIARVVLRGLARFTSRRGLEILVTSPWTLHARMAAQRGVGFTSSAKPIGRFARFPRVTAAVAI